MRKTHKKVLAAAVAILAVVSLSACGGTPSGGGSTTATGPVSIEFWHRTFTPVENEWYAGIVDRFNAAQTDVKVVGTEVPADAWDEKMKAAQAAGTAPDIYTQAGPVKEAVDQGLFYDLNKLIDPALLDQIIPGARPFAVVDGHYYAYPLLLEGQEVLWWNKDLLQKAGLDPNKGPATWQELLDMCATIKPTLADGQYCIAPAQNEIDLAWSSWGQQYNFNGHLALNDKWTEPAVQEQGYKDMIQLYKTLWDKGYVAQQPLAGYLEAKDFGPGKVAFKIGGTWMMSEIASDYPDMLAKTGMTAVPTSAPGNTRSTTTLGDFKWVIDAKAKHPEAAAKFMTWVLAGDPANLVPFFVNTQFTKVPCRQVVQDAVAADPAAGKAAWSGPIMQIIPTGIMQPSYSWDVSVAVGTAIMAGMTGTASIDDALATAAAAIKTVIERDDLPSKVPTS